MIFVTVGVQLPFDRLIRAVDEWADRVGRTDIVAQTGASTYAARRLTSRPTIGAAEFRTLVEEAELVVAHAGMGSIITALELGKPIIVLPRRAALGEHRNDHQLATASYMARQGLVRVAEDETDLVRMLDGQQTEPPRPRIAATASPQLVSRLASFIQEAPARRP